MKVFKRLVLINLTVAVEEFLDPFQFAYRAKRCVEKMLFYYVFNSVYAHLKYIPVFGSCFIVVFHGGEGEGVFFKCFQCDTKSPAFLR